MQPIRVSRQTARRFLAEHHLLAPSRSVPGGIDGVRQVVRALGSVQFDPLSVAGRNHDLVLHARVAGYDSAWTDELIYGERDLFETDNKGLSILPIEDLPWYRVVWTQYPEAIRIVESNRDLADIILDRIRTEGPLSTADFESERTISWFGNSRRLSSAVLDALVATGVLGTARRMGNRRYFDETARLYPRTLLQKQISRREQLKYKMHSRYQAHGLLGISSPAMVGLGKAAPDPDEADSISRTELRDDLVREGQLRMVEIEGISGPRFVLTSEVDLLASPTDSPPSVTFLAPLDPLCWDPKFLRQLWDFDWVWEVYKPESKRLWGYYVLPILFRDRLVGRIEPRIDRSQGIVRILGLAWESWFNPAREPNFVAAMREALSAYLSFASATEIEWPDHLRRDGRLLSPV